MAAADSSRPTVVRRMAGVGRPSRLRRRSANGGNRRISPVAAHSGDRLLSERTAGNRSEQRKPLLIAPKPALAISTRDRPTPVDLPKFVAPVSNRYIARRAAIQ